MCRLIRAPNVFGIDQHLRGLAFDLTLFGGREAGEIGCAVLFGFAQQVPKPLVLVAQLRTPRMSRTSLSSSSGSGVCSSTGVVMVSNLLCFELWPSAVAHTAGPVPNDVVNSSGNR